MATAVDNTATKKLDPVTFEILRHRIEEIVGEMYYTIARVSGNLVVIAAGDHQEGILNAQGEAVLVSGGIVEWVTCLEAGGKYLTQTYEDNPGFDDGDQFIVNHPYITSVHCMDVQILAPVFWEGKRIAWLVTAGHQLDLGGMVPASACPMATEVYQEGLHIAALKIVEKGVLRKDVVETIKGMVRLPDQGMLDIASKIAANNIARARLIEMIERYGIDTVLTLFDQIIQYSETMVRSRLSKIPDGRWKAVHYVESLRQPEEPYLKVAVTAIKEGDELTLDFTGSSPQSIGSQNVAEVGAISNAICPFLMLVCPDVPWSTGAWRPVKFILPEGTVVNPRKPAATSWNTPPGAGYTTIGAVHEALEKMLLACEETRNEAFANTDAAFHHPLIAGLDKEGNFCTVCFMEGIAGGMGALPDRDGVDSCGNMWTPKTQIPNIEMTEMLYPVMFLVRKEMTDTGGPGKFRGGVGIQYAIIPWDSKGSELSAMTVGMGSEARLCSGLAGGYPAPNAQWGMIRNSDALEKMQRGEMARALGDIKGPIEMLTTGSMTTMGKTDVCHFMAGGGGGYGDPIDRDPERVLRDVELGYVSIKAARDVYGVVISPKTMRISARGTAKHREKMIQQRLLEGRV